ncbi:ENTH-domain-containing protein [Agrocybe pediades]|nr:ENTH-domain-containing protein [Agrocybe pediades]
MDKLESLSSTLQNITLYDIKSMYNQAKNVVLNISEMEAKVREATNDDPWGASSTLMQEIAQGTFHFQYFNEIMPSIYSRFMEKEARQWRQIYKALQLLEYLIKHGSERVVDDARSHISTLKMLRNFHYIDDKGKDEGINVRNRSRELVELLSDVEKIRAERRKAKANKNKYIGVGNDGFGGGMSFESSGGGRYGGFGSYSLGGGSSSYNNYGNSDHYASGGGSSRTAGGSRSSFNDSRRGFEEYNAGDDEVPTRKPSTPVRASSVRTPVRRETAAAPAPPPAPAVNLLDFDDDAFSAPAPTAPAVNKALPAVSNPAVSLDDDDFADFQAAPVAAPAQTTSPAPAAAGPNKTLMDMLNSAPTAAAPANPGFMQPQQPQLSQPGFGMNMGGGMGMGIGMAGHRQTPSYSAQPGQGQFSAGMMPQQPPMQAQNSFGGVPAMRPTSTLSPTTTSSSAPKPPAAAPAKSANFDDLWTMSLGGSSSAKPAAGATTGKSIKDLEKEKAMAGLWGGQQPKPGVGGAPAGAASQQNAFGSFGNAAPPSSSGGGIDDLFF